MDWYEQMLVERDKLEKVALVERARGNHDGADSAWSVIEWIDRTLVRYLKREISMLFQKKGDLHVSG